MWLKESAIARNKNAVSCSFELRFDLSTSPKEHLVYNERARMGGGGCLFVLSDRGDSAVVPGKECLFAKDQSTANSSVFLLLALHNVCVFILHEKAIKQRKLIYLSSFVSIYFQYCLRSVNGRMSHYTMLH